MLNVSALRQFDILTNSVDRSTIPFAIEGIEDDEWIKIRKIRNSLDDLDAWSKAAVPVKEESEVQDGDILAPGQEDPDVAEIENRSADVMESQFTIRESDRYRYIWHYMVLDCNLHDGPTPEDMAASRRGRKLDPKNFQDMDDVYTLIAADIITILATKGGGVAVKPVTGPDGKPAGFRQANTVGDTKPTPEAENSADGVLGEAGSSPAGDEVDVPGSEGNAS